MKVLKQIYNFIKAIISMIIIPILVIIMIIYLFFSLIKV